MIHSLNTYLLANEESKKYRFYQPPTIKVIPLKDMTGYEAWQITQLMFQLHNGRIRTVEEIIGLGPEVTRHLEIIDNNQD